MKRIQMVDLDAARVELGSELEDAVLRVVRSTRYVGGPEIAAFETAFAAYTGVRYAIGVANGTDAIELALVAVGLKPGDEVLVPANTFIATAEAVVAAGGVPRFVDVRPDTGLIDLEKAAAAIGARTRAITPVHLYGRMVDMDAVMRLAKQANLLVVEDAAQAHGARSNGRHAGTIGHAGTFSFYPGKNLGALGDAGAVITSDDAVADRIRRLRDHGRRGRNEHEVVGRNSRLDPLQAAVLSLKLQHLDEWNARRRVAADELRAALPTEILDRAAPDPETESNHLFPVLVDDRDGLAAWLDQREIASGIHYALALPDTQAFAGERCEVASSRAARQLSLPMHPHLADVDISRITSAVNDFVSARG